MTNNYLWVSRGLNNRSTYDLIEINVGVAQRIPGEPQTQKNEYGRPKQVWGLVQESLSLDIKEISTNREYEFEIKGKFLREFDVTIRSYLRLPTERRILNTDLRALPLKAIITDEGLWGLVLAASKPRTSSTPQIEQAFQDPFLQ